MPLLEASKVCKEYGEGPAKVLALKDVDLGVEAGEFVAVMGPSGCGKSTLLHLIGGIDGPTSGRVLLDGQDLGSLSDTARSVVRRRQIGFVFQKMNLLPTLTAIDNVALPLRIDGIGRAAAHERAHATLTRVAVAHRAKHFPHELSGGEQQRVAIARALVIRPAILLADEPTGALDTVNGRHILELLRDCVEQGQTIVMVTHDADMARHAGRIVRMQDGRMVPRADCPDVPPTLVMPH
jgi:putative ABC transport system ATP-binding protein